MHQLNNAARDIQDRTVGSSQVPSRPIADAERPAAAAAVVPGFFTEWQMDMAGVVTVRAS
ncbi:MAG TPA: hypothetical protein VHJ78_06165 [Actinomycetota bacterium]|nr:hypothetical protein [Actinomycetota bacterium]